MSFTTINLKTIGDERGSLIALENNAEIPFEVKRVYYIFGRTVYSISETERD